MKMKFGIELLLSNTWIANFMSQQMRDRPPPNNNHILKRLFLIICQKGAVNSLSVIARVFKTCIDPESNSVVFLTGHNWDLFAHRL